MAKSATVVSWRLGQFAQVLQWLLDTMYSRTQSFPGSQEVREEVGVGN